MKVLLSGGSGLIGTALREQWSRDGHTIVQLVRREPTGPGEVRWNPSEGWLDATAFDGVDVVVNLAGAGVGDRRWDHEYKQVIRQSRLDTTTTLATTMAGLANPPGLVVQASAVGYYGSRGDEVLTEKSCAGNGFLADITKDWEAAMAPCTAAGIDVAFLRTGLVMASVGGAFPKLLTPVKLGVGGPIGNGQMWWPWITLADQTGAIDFIIRHHIAGVLNLVGPQPVRNALLMRALGRAFGRPTVLPVPATALRLAVGEFADDILASQRAEPTVLLDAGYQFMHPTVDAAAQWLAAQK